MTPEQQAEYQRRQQRKALTINVAVQSLQTLIATHPETSPDELAKNAFDIGEAFARERHARGHED
jgi:hypothetical protein